jgi:hypothetical protein
VEPGRCRARAGVERGSHAVFAQRGCPMCTTPLQQMADGMTRSSHTSACQSRRLAGLPTHGGRRAGPCPHADLAGMETWCHPPRLQDPPQRRWPGPASGGSPAGNVTPRSLALPALLLLQAGGGAPSPHPHRRQTCRPAPVPAPAPLSRWTPRAGVSGVAAPGAPPGAGGPHNGQQQADASHVGRVWRPVPGRWSSFWRAG